MSLCCDQVLSLYRGAHAAPSRCTDRAVRVGLIFSRTRFHYPRQSDRLWSYAWSNLRTLCSSGSPDISGGAGCRCHSATHGRRRRRGAAACGRAAASVALPSSPTSPQRSTAACASALRRRRRCSAPAAPPSRSPASRQRSARHRCCRRRRVHRCMQNGSTRGLRRLPRRRSGRGRRFTGRMIRIGSSALRRWGGAGARRRSRRWGRSRWRR